MNGITGTGSPLPPPRGPSDPIGPSHRDPGLGPPTADGARFSDRPEFAQGLAPGAAGISTQAAVPTGSVTERVRGVVADGIRNGESRDAIRNRVIDAEIDRAFGPGTPPEVKAAIADQVAMDPSLRNLFDEVYLRASRATE